MSKYRTMKLFDCYDMPEDIRKEFFANWEGIKGNDSFVRIVPGECEDERWAQWVLANGCGPCEEVLISYWW